MNKKSVLRNWGFSLGNISWWVGLVVLMGSLMACGEDPQQVFDTAQFEEQQHNQAHARELYERILHDHPDSQVARKAQERLQEWKKDNP